MDLAELATMLRRYAGTEHGKRAGQHAEIMRGIFADPQGLADHISAILRGAAENEVRKDPEGVRAILNSIG